MRHQGSVPHRRDARLAIGFVFLDDQQLFHRQAGNRAVGMLGRIAQHIIHHHAVGHGGINRPQPIFAVQPFGGPGAAFFDGALARPLGPGHGFQHPVQRAEESRPAGALMRGARGRRGAPHPRTIREYEHRADFSPAGVWRTTPAAARSRCAPNSSSWRDAPETSAAAGSAPAARSARWTNSSRHTAPAGCG